MSAIAGIVYPCFIEAGDHIVSKTQITRVEAEIHAHDIIWQGRIARRYVIPSQ